jgi:peptidoglycan hydrolase CwlO-like protein
VQANKAHSLTQAQVKSLQSNLSEAQNQLTTAQTQIQKYQTQISELQKQMTLQDVNASHVRLAEMEKRFAVRGVCEDW